MGVVLIVGRWACNTPYLSHQGCGMTQMVTVMVWYLQRPAMALSRLTLLKAAHIAVLPRFAVCVCCSNASGVAVVLTESHTLM